jgi:uncharacterized membrane protein
MKNIARIILYLLILVVGVSAMYNYGFKPLGTGLPPSMKLNFETHHIGLYIHVLASVVALLLGPLQFWTRLRQQLPRLHRWMGRTYLGFGVLFGGLSGLYMSLFANGTMIVKCGFACLALAWLYTGFKAYQSIRAGDVEQHRAYMVRNFALTLAAVSLRVYLPLSMMAGVDFGTAYAVIAWMAWIPNLLVAEMLLRWERKRQSSVLQYRQQAT